MRIHSFNEADQEQIDGTEIAGELRTRSATAALHVGVYFNDATGSKMSFYLQYAVNVAAVSCTEGRQQLLGRLEISSNTPADPQRLPESVAGYDVLRDRFIKRGQQFVVGDLFAPVGGTITDVYRRRRDARSTGHRPVATVASWSRSRSSSNPGRPIWSPGA